MAFAKIVAATDFSSGSVAALAAASLIARSDGAEVVVAHALETPTVFGGELPVPTEVIEELKDDALQGLEHAQRDVRALGVSRVSSQLLVGVVGGLLSFVESSKADLVVVGTHGRTGMSRILLGSMAEKIVRLAPCSVLVARSDHELVRFSHVLCAVDG
ncbi:MAG TPA: universal stress protein, partial [Kofleriaceae bacterium]